ncbi:hypothetical protein [Candidatus Odyssella thessalonicensis]|uniref:hypothetical protein n=1 Tax=Candidatus Odyssella thessalonicensis TaxID=84647 RepID=UPI000225AEBC|nr:hypothetical protein [Candidatus Odyssella thessalonicensis]
MKLIAFLILTATLHAEEISSDWLDPSKQAQLYQRLALLYAPQSNNNSSDISSDSASSFGTLDTFTLNSAIPTSEFDSQALPFKQFFMDNTSPLQDDLAEDKDFVHLTSDSLPQQQMQLLLPREDASLTNIADLEGELDQLRQENQTLSRQLATMTQLLEKNNQMLVTLLTALQEHGVQIEGIENSQLRIENDLLTLADKLKNWKNEMLHSNEHLLTKTLRYVKLIFNITSSTGTALSTYYTLNLCTSILPGVLTPPGWVLVTSSAAIGALYYCVYAL